MGVAFLCVSGGDCWRYTFVDGITAHVLLVAICRTHFLTKGYRGITVWHLRVCGTVFSGRVCGLYNSANNLRSVLFKNKGGNISFLNQDDLLGIYV